MEILETFLWNFNWHFSNLSAAPILPGYAVSESIWARLMFFLRLIVTSNLLCLPLLPHFFHSRGFCSSLSVTFLHINRPHSRTLDGSAPSVG